MILCRIEMSGSEEKNVSAEEKRTAMQTWKEEYEAMLSHKPKRHVSSNREDRFVMPPPPQGHSFIHHKGSGWNYQRNRRFILCAAQFSTYWFAIFSSCWVQCPLATSRSRTNSWPSSCKSQVSQKVRTVQHWGLNADSWIPYSPTITQTKFIRCRSALVELKMQFNYLFISRCR